MDTMKESSLNTHTRRLHALYKYTCHSFVYTSFQSHARVVCFASSTSRGAPRRRARTFASATPWPSGPPRRAAGYPGTSTSTLAPGVGRGAERETPRACLSSCVASRIHLQHRAVRAALAPHGHSLRREVEPVLRRGARAAPPVDVPPPPTRVRRRAEPVRLPTPTLGPARSYRPKPCPARPAPPPVYTAASTRAQVDRAPSPTRRAAKTGRAVATRPPRDPPPLL